MPKVAPPAFVSGHDASQWLLFVGATTTNPLGQVKTFSWTQALVTSDQIRVSDSATYFTDTGVTVTGPLELWQDAANTEQTAVGGQTLTVDDAAKTLIAQFHTLESTAGTLVKTYTFTNFRITSIEAGPREGQSNTYWAYNWRATLLAAT